MTSSTEDPQIELKRALDYLETISKSDGESLRHSIYKSFSALSYLALEAKLAKFKPGWAHELKDANLNTVFHEKEATLIENILLTFLKPIVSEEQKGGAASQVPKTSKAGILQDVKGALALINPDDISLDRTYWKVNKFLKGLDEQTHALSREIGPFRFFYDSKTDIPIPIPIPFPPYTVSLQIPPRTIPVLIGSFVEAIRLIFSVGPTSNELTRKILSIVITLIDLLKGEWKHSILSFAGYYGQYPLIAGLIGKVFLNVFSMIAPDIQDRVIFDIYRSGKSMFIGGFLWVFSTFAPAPVRLIVKKQMDIIKEKVLKVNGDIKGAEDKMQEAAGAVGQTIDLNKIPETFIVSFDDIQNLQSIVRQQSVMCSSEFQEAIKPLLIIIPVRLLLEMLNIPTDPDSLDMECGALKGIPLEKTIEGALTPKFTPDASSSTALNALKDPEAAMKAAALGVVPGANALKDPQAAMKAAALGAVPGANALKDPQAAIKAAALGAAANAIPQVANAIPQAAALKGAANAVKDPKAALKGLTKKGGSRNRPIDRAALIDQVILDTA